MTAWQDRTIEQRNLLNPAFCAVAVWHLARGYATEVTTLGTGQHALPFELAFVGASLILRGQTREQLPRTITSSLATWVHDHPLERSAVAKGVFGVPYFIVDGEPISSLRGTLFVLHDAGFTDDEAIEAVQRQPYDVVLMDVQMPEMDGLEASRRIVARWPDAAARPRIVAMTANAMQGDREECLAAGMDDYLTKPIRVDALVTALDNVTPRKDR